MARTFARLALVAALAAPAPACADPPVEDAVPVATIELGAGDALGLRTFRHAHRRRPAPEAEPEPPFDPDTWLREWRARKARASAQ